MVNHFVVVSPYFAVERGRRVLLNESGNPEEYAKLLQEFIRPFVRQTASEGSVRRAGNTSESSARVLELCRCGPGIDVFAYHSYPGYELTPIRAMDSGKTR